MRKIIFACIALICLGLALFAFFQSFDQDELTRPEPFHAIPLDAALVFESGQIGELWRDLSDRSAIWKAMQVSDLYFRLNTAAQALDSLIRHDDQFRGFLANSPAVISAHKTGAGEIDYLIAIPIAAGLSNTEIQSSLSSLLRQKSQPTQHVFEEQTIFSTESFLSDKPLHFFIDHQILVLSFSATLIESSVRALLNNQSVWSDALFRKLRETRGEQSRGQIYIQYAQFAELLQPFADKTHRNIPFFSAHFAKWSALDIRIDANAVLLNGFAAVSDSSNQWLSLFKGIPANSPIFFEYMPENTSFFAFFGFDNIANHLSRRQALWQDTSENQQLTLLQKTCQCDLKTLATGWIADQMAVALLPPLRGDTSFVELAYFRSHDQALASENLQFLGDAFSGGEQVKTEHYLNRTIQQLPIQGYYGEELGSFFDGISNPYYVLIDDIVVMSPSLAGIKASIEAYERKENLAHSELFESTRQQMGNASNFMLYNSPMQSPKLLSDWLKEPFRGQLSGQSELIKQFPGWFYQLAYHKDNLFYNSTYIHHAPYVELISNKLWSGIFQAPVMALWSDFENHQTGAREILVQDSLNRIYLVSNTGKIYWDKQLDGRIIGEIAMIDGLKNKKWQLVFNTENKLYILDRNGQNLDHFPIEFAHSTSLPVSVIDYDSDRTYRFFVTSVNGDISAYDLQGKPVKGWEFEGKSRSINTPLQHIRIRKKDYLFTIQDSTKVLLLDRRGSIREKVEESAPNHLVTSPILFLGGDINQSGFFAIDDNGNGVAFRFEGKTEYTSLGLGKLGHGQAAMFLRTDGPIVAAYSGEELRFFSGGKFKGFHTVALTAAVKLVWHQVGKSLYLTAFEQETGLVYLYSEKGELQAGYPIESSREPLILPNEKSGHLIMITNESNTIEAYPLIP